MKNNIIKGIAALTVLSGIAGIAWIANDKPAPVYAEDNDHEEDTAIVSATADNSEYIYCIGSVSKMYVTAAAMRLADEGRLSLDAPVTDYIPEFKMADERYKQITVRMLMDHTAGLLGSMDPGGLLYNDNATIQHDELLNILSTQRLKAGPGEYAAYCNDGFSLLEIVVERVSGMTFSEYVKTVLASRTGGTDTGLPVDMLYSDMLAPAYTADGLLYENGMTMCAGAGGVYSTASDVANFGTAFFKGNNSLLSEAAKSEMAVRWDKGIDGYHDENGLGWDIVSKQEYEDKGISIVAKGGDSGMNHAWLMVAPEEEISISVLTNGGNSYLNALVADAIMEAVLSEQGEVLEDSAPAVYEAVTEIPAEYDRYEGMYLISNNLGGGDEICYISFPEHKYMRVESTGIRRTTVTDYMLTTEGCFAELAYAVENNDIKDAKFALDPQTTEFVTGDNGKVYIAAKATQSFPGMGNVERSMYVGERLEENPVSPEVMNAWSSCDGKEFLGDNDIWSSYAYDVAVGRLFVPEAMPGYVYVAYARGAHLLKIVDETTAVAFTTMPSSSNRDILDIKIRKDEEGTKLILSTGLEFIMKEDIPYFSAETKAVELKDREAGWYRIGNDMTATSLLIDERPVKSAVNVYNRYGELVYSTHIIDTGNELPLPEDGLIVFLGESGGSIKLR